MKRKTQVEHVAPPGAATTARWFVVGIPNSVPREYGETIARIATDAALKHWNRTRVSRPTPSRDDRRLYTKAAKEAVRKHARNQAA